MAKVSKQLDSWKISYLSLKDNFKKPCQKFQKSKNRYEISGHVRLDQIRLVLKVIKELVCTVYGDTKLGRGRVGKLGS